MTLLLYTVSGNSSVMNIG